MLQLDQTYTHNGQSVAWGAMGQGEPVVLIHGFPWSAQSWRHIAPWLATSRRVYVFDMLGCGRSAKFDGQKVDESVQSALLAALIRHWGLERPHVIAHDFGGLAALRTHFLHGIDYGALHLIDAVALLPSGSPFYRHVAQHEAAFAGLPAYAHEALFRAYIQNAAHYPLREEAIEIYADPWRGEIGQPAFYRQIAQADTANIEEVEQRYAPTDFPLHLIWGELDSFIPVERGRRLQGRLGADSFTAISRASHLVQEDAPEAVLGALMATR